ncbi:MAG TPA: polysaccharide deacetylase family protein [Kofleriaceae bacterium]|nr:polysaccharide deacetylase family protein [Kofleriaceae bacterium]
MQESPGGLKRAVKRAVMLASSGTPMGKLVCWHGSRKITKLALTFDDGPHPIYTPIVLDILAKTAARATFFLLGRQIERYPDLVERIALSGHEIGIHGYDHTSVNLPAQAKKTDALLRDRHGLRARLFRPPRGELCARDGLWMLAHGFQTVLWSFDALDSARSEGKVSCTIAYDRILPGDIVLLHDDNALCAAELSDLVANTAQRALAPSSVSELLAAR